MLDRDPSPVHEGVRGRGHRRRQLTGVGDVLKVRHVLVVLHGWLVRGRDTPREELVPAAGLIPLALADVVRARLPRRANMR